MITAINRKPTRLKYDAIVIGSGPNGFACAITLACAGLATLLIEGAETIGGGTRTAELTLPGFKHDICSTVHPLAVDSEIFRSLPLAKYGLEWIYPPACLAHPHDDGSAALLYRSIAATAATLGEDGAAYTRLFEPLAQNWDKLSAAILAPARLPQHPLVLARFGISAIRSAEGLAKSRFKGMKARALLAGCAAHSMLSLEESPSAAFGMVLALSGHAVGWAFPKGGAAQITTTMAAYFKDLGGEIITGWQVKNLRELPPSRLTMFSTTPRQLVEIAGDYLSAGYRRRLERFKYGAAAFKLDYALSAPPPWKNPLVATASTVHLGGSLEEIVASERAMSHGKIPLKPFVLVTQPSLFDTSRAPAGKHVLWAYCHVPGGSKVDMVEIIEKQLERFAPGFRETVLARHVMTPADLEMYNPNYIGGDINGGIQNWAQLFTRPVISLNPYATPTEGLYICSSSTPPGGGVHGMSGFWSAKSALGRLGIPLKT